jgi:hypothetical protein
MFWVPTGLSKNVALSQARGSMFREIGRGLGYVIGHPQLRLLMILAFIPALLAMPYVMLLPGFVQRDLEQGQAAVGWLNSFSGIGALIGSLFIASLNDFSRKPLLQVVSGVVGGLGLAMLGLASVAFGYPGAIAAIILMGLALTAYQTLNMTMIMSEAEPQYYGRVMSINMLTFSVMPLMAFPLGLIADRIGATNLFMIQGGLVVASMVVITLLNPRYILGRFTPPARPMPAGGPAGGGLAGAGLAGGGLAAGATAGAPAPASFPTPASNGASHTPLPVAGGPAVPALAPATLAPPAALDAHTSPSSAPQAAPIADREGAA